MPGLSRDTNTTRRAFLKRGALATLAIPAGVTALSSCVAAEPAVAKAGPAAAKSPEMTHAASTVAATAASKVEDMDALHEAGVKAFPAKTDGRGNRLLAPSMDRGVKVYDLTCSEVEWEISPGKRMKAWVYNRQLPGPMIRVTEGDRVRIRVKNELPESTAVHFHGLEVPNDQDGVPFITQPPIKPGQSFTYEFTVTNFGSHMYHSHHNAAKQVGMGLLGAFIVDPKNPKDEPVVDVDAVMILNDMAHGYTLNGKGFPATEPIVCKRGQKVRIRFMNEGMQIHPMHLHGMHMTVIAKDGWTQPMPWKCDTLNIAPGERWDVIVNATNPGTWAFHCHILTHAESEHGMFGMVTALVVQ